MTRELPEPGIVERPPAVPRWRVRNKITARDSSDDLHVHVQDVRDGRRIVLSQGANVVRINVDNIESLCLTLRAAVVWSDE